MTMTVAFSVTEAVTLRCVVSDLGVTYLEYLRLLDQQPPPKPEDEPQHSPRPVVVSFGADAFEKASFEADAKRFGFATLSAYIRAMHAVYVREHGVPAAPEPPVLVKRGKRATYFVLSRALLAQVTGAATAARLPVGEWLTKTLTAAAAGGQR